ncbi:MAG: GDSL-type esterase/lipase family protein [Acutalibacteraceae bacterium]
MKKSSKVIIILSVAVLLFVVLIAALSNSPTLPGVSRRVKSIEISQTAPPSVSVYSAEGGVTYSIDNRIETENIINDATSPAYSTDPDLSTTAPVYYVTEYTGQKSQYDETMVLNASTTYVRPLGRTVYDNGVRWLSMSGSGIEFDCEGVSADIQLLDEKTASTSDNHRPRVAVYVNGYLVFDRSLDNYETHVKIDLNTCGGRAVVRVIKLSESVFSYIGIGMITVVGKRPAVPTQPKQLKLEFIGDSITCGFGIDETDNSKKFSTTTENFSKTYAYLTALAFDADYSAVCYSGYGVYSGYTSTGVRNTTNVIFDRYEKAIDNKTFDSSYASQQWNFSEYTPNLVVINLGTNDASFCKSQESRAGFVGEYKRLLSIVRGKNPNAYILCILGDMNNSMYPYIEQAVSEFKAETGDTKIDNTKIDFKMGETDVVISGHPGAQSNRCAAQSLISKIQLLIQNGQIY